MPAAALARQGASVQGPYAYQSAQRLRALLSAQLGEAPCAALLVQGQGLDDAAALRLALQVDQ